MVITKNPVELLKFRLGEKNSVQCKAELVFLFILLVIKFLKWAQGNLPTVEMVKIPRMYT